MQEKTAAAKDIELARDKAKLDAMCKRILANKVILAWILKECLEEYKGYSCSEVVDCIEGTPEISEKPVHLDEVMPEKITGIGTEDKTVTEGTVTYDIRFTAKIPGTDYKVHLYVNIEAQNDYEPGYPLIKRGIYYCCRMISAQYQREFTKSHYENLKKVYSLWICINPPEERKNTITEYRIEEKTIIGESREIKENYDLMNCMMICLGDPEDTDGILRLLDTLMSGEMSTEKKKDVLERDYKIEMTRELESEVSGMCNYSDGIWMKGLKQGIERGKAEGIAEGIAEGKAEGIAEGKAEGIIKTYRKFNVNRKQIAEELIKELSITREKANEYINEYWQA